ncbi:MAG: hypothetical protein ACIAQZ_08630 [Sedimentisphaeraceae bacterium JB056]
MAGPGVVVAAAYSVIAFLDERAAVGRPDKEKADHSGDHCGIMFSRPFVHVTSAI